ncbi:MAG: hypothetical protein V4735_09665 [Pseudomonadota bacterium]
MTDNASADHPKRPDPLSDPPLVPMENALVTTWSQARALAIRRRHDPVDVDAINADYYQKTAAILLSDLSGRQQTEAISALGKAMFPALERAFNPRPPERYVIPYYLPKDQDAPVDPALVASFDVRADDSLVISKPDGTIVVQQVPYIRADNPAEPVNAHQQRAVMDAFATIEAQLPGRFSFVETHDPNKALLSFAAVPKMHKDVGVATMESGRILLNNEYYQSSFAYNTIMGHAALHEIGHGLGLEHPHPFTKADNSLSIEGVSYYQTVMTYSSENKAVLERVAKGHGDYRTLLAEYFDANNKGHPVSLMPADINALKRLYPIASDGVSAAPGAAVAGVLGEPVHVTHLGEQGRAQAIPFPDQGVVYHPLHDSGDDTLVISSGKPDPGWQQLARVGLPYLSVRQVVTGTELSQPYGRGTTVVPVKPETIVLAGTEIPQRIQMEGNTALVIAPAVGTPNQDGWLQNMVEVRGIQNRVTMNAQRFAETDHAGDTHIQVYSGAQVDIAITDAARLPTATSRLRYTEPSCCPICWPTELRRIISRSPGGRMRSSATISNWPRAMGVCRR